jgi:hypothetical protein
MIEVEELERRMRPGAWSRVGFLGANERLEDVLEADHQTLSELGLTTDELAEPLECLLGAADWGFYKALQKASASSSPEIPEDVAQAVASAEAMFGSAEPCDLPFLALTGESEDVSPSSEQATARIPATLVGGRYEVAAAPTFGIQHCPWSAEEFGGRPCGSDGADWVIRERKRGLEMRGPVLILHLMREHGFFEGFESPYRVDPRALAELLQLGPFVETTPLS